MSGTEDNTPLFRDINADDADPEVTEIESLCVNCEEQVTLFRHCFICSSDYSKYKCTNTQEISMLIKNMPR